MNARCIIFLKEFLEMLIWRLRYGYPSGLYCNHIMEKHENRQFSILDIDLLIYYYMSYCQLSNF